MEQLRLEYLAREEKFMLDGDRNELRTIKQELDELRSEVVTTTLNSMLCYFARGFIYLVACNGRSFNMDVCSLSYG